jgi:hypothetical protein
LLPLIAGGQKVSFFARRYEKQIKKRKNHSIASAGSKKAAPGFPNAAF